MGHARSIIDELKADPNLSAEFRAALDPKPAPVAPAPDDARARLEGELDAANQHVKILYAQLAALRLAGDGLAAAAKADWDCPDDRGDDAMRIASELDKALTAWRKAAGKQESITTKGLPNG